jgi:hypothetical protein
MGVHQQAQAAASTMVVLPAPAALPEQGAAAETVPTTAYQLTNLALPLAASRTYRRHQKKR